MKKISIFSCLFLIFICSAFAYDFSNVSLSTQGVDLSKEEESWLISKVATKLTENLSTYADINIIDTVNKKDIINAQKREEINGNVQAGNLKSAAYIAFLKITKTFSGYTLNLALKNIETGDILATVVTKGKYKKAENLYTGYGSAVNEITIRFCDALGIVLEDYEREVLMNGEDGRMLAEKEATEEAEEAAEEERFYKNLEKERQLQRKQLEKERKEMERRQKEAQSEREKAERKQARKEAISNRPMEKDFKHSLIAINGAYTFTDPTATSIGLEFAGGMLPFIYFDYKVNLLNLDTAKTKIYPITDPKLNFVLTNMFQIGLNIPCGGVVELFGSVGAGFNWYCPIQVFTESSDFISTIDKVPYTSKVDFTLGVSAGMQIEVVRHLGLLSSYNMTYIYEKKLYYHSVDVGIAFVF